MTNPTHTPGERPTFPILGSRGAKIDLQLVEDHGKQANVEDPPAVSPILLVPGNGCFSFVSTLNQE